MHLLRHGARLRNEAHVAETEEGSIEAEEATFSAVYNYHLATDGSSERYSIYSTGYNKEQERGVRR